MAITIDWGQKIINVPKADLTLIQSTPTEIRQLNLDTFRQTLNDLQDDPAGMTFPTTHNHNTSLTVGGVTLARVIEIINGYTVTFEDGQYAVNLVGANSNVGDVVNVNQVSVRSANSAGLQDLSTVLAAAYNGEVCVDPSSPNSGTDVPIGTRGVPVNNLEDAKAIADKENAHNIRILKSMTIRDVDFSAGYRFITDSPVTEQIVVDPSANIRNCDFEFCNITGTLDGNNIYRQCVLGDITYTSGFVFQCSLNGTITLEPGALMGALDCFSNTLAGQPNPKIDFNGSGQLLLRNYSGVIELLNHTDDSADGDVCIDMASGVVIVRDSCTAGFFPIRGIARVQDESTGTCDVRDLTVNQLVKTNATDLEIINQGIKNASLLIPHTTDLPS
jgi:hypothetical protein